MSADELEACRLYIVENFNKGFMKSSAAPWAAPILFVPKANGKLRLCVDYRKLNAITRKDRYPLPLIKETLSRISQAKFFTKIGIRQAFHRIRMHPNDEELTTFRTRYGAYKYKVLPFGLTNGPSTFQRYINDALMGYRDDFCSAYIDDILIYSNTLGEHKSHVLKVLQRLKAAGLQADLDKCEFHVQETKFLGFIIGVNGVSVDPVKVAVVKDWKEPTTVNGVQSFLGFCNCSRQAAWAGILSQYNFHITYRPEKENAAADALSRKAEDLKTQKDKDAQRHAPFQTARSAGTKRDDW